ncbi:MAG: hypothetical protein J0H75_06020, partial [Rhizobiales bacterium]|nr:hypothetical protein [Hyphomicrobiales bacterium]
MTSPPMPQTATLPFSFFAPPIAPQTPLRAAITAACRRPETECLPPMVEAATIGDAARVRIAA